jgi:hypothetical protein
MKTILALLGCLSIATLSATPALAQSRGAVHGPVGAGVRGPERGAGWGHGVAIGAPRVRFGGLGYYPGYYPYGAGRGYGYGGYYGGAHYGGGGHFGGRGHFGGGGAHFGGGGHGGGGHGGGGHGGGGHGGGHR